MKKRAKIMVTDFSLPDDIIAEILQRLPPKSLLRFKCVSRSWCFLISSKYFIKAQLEHARNAPLTNQNTILITAHETDEDYDDWGDHADYFVRHCPAGYLVSQQQIHDVPECHFDYPITHFATCLIGCCNGLCCINVDREYIILWNPATGLSHKLPPALKEDNYVPTIWFGFGYDESNDDYKVLLIQQYSKFPHRVYKLYSLKENSWKKLDDFMVDLMTVISWKTVDNIQPYITERRAVTLNGKLHWAIKINSSSFIIVTFDLGSETAGWFEQPCSGHISNSCASSLGVVQGCLCVVVCEDPQYTGPWQVWVMKEYGVKESWYKLTTLPKVPRFDVPYTFSFSIFSISEDEIIFERSLLLFVYNPKTECLRQLNITKDCHQVRHIALCIQTLVSPLPYGRETGSGRRETGSGKIISLVFSKLFSWLHQFGLVFFK